MEKLDKIHKINSKFTINHNVMKKFPMPMRQSGLSLFERCLWKTLKFQTKLVIAGGLVYYCASNGLWGEPEDTYKFLNNLCAKLHIFQ